MECRTGLSDEQTSWGDMLTHGARGLHPVRRTNVLNTCLSTYMKAQQIPGAGGAQALDRLYIQIIH